MKKFIEIGKCEPIKRHLDIKPEWLYENRTPRFRSEDGIVLLANTMQSLLNGEIEAQDYLEFVDDQKTGLQSITFPEFALSISYDGCNQEKIGKVTFEKHSVGDLNSGYGRTVYVGRSENNISIKFGLTVHNSFGTWSSCPAHKFEVEKLTAPIYGGAFDEIFAFVTMPKDSWGIQHILGRGGEELNVVKDRDIVHIPISSHPVVAAPATIMIYFWAYVGGEEKFNKDGRI